VRIHHVVEGPAEAPVLVLSNSLGTSLDLWSENLAALTRSFRVVRYDQRGHGDSEVPSEPFGVDELGEDVLRLLDDLGVERASFCGVSMGGATGMWLAVNAPERVDRLVVACTSAKFGETDKWFVRARIVREDGLEAIVDSILRRWFTPGFRPDLVARLRAGFLATPTEGYAACCEALAGWDYRGRLGEVAAPTLVIAGAHDIATTPEEGAFIAGRIPGAQLLVLPDAAHLANVQQPDAFAEAVLAHLALTEAA
jgi:3-oxoadipate enol-lactonase